MLSGLEDLPGDFPQFPLEVFLIEGRGGGRRMAGRGVQDVPDQFGPADMPAGPLPKVQDRLVQPDRLPVE